MMKGPCRVKASAVLKTADPKSQLTIEFPAKLKKNYFVELPTSKTR